MSSLTLVRHGQASFFADDYDQLSELGNRQAVQLGQYWLANEQNFDTLFTGPRQRQQQTAHLVCDIFQQAGVSVPEVVELSAWDEHHVDQLVMQQASQLASRSPELTALVDRLQSATDPHQIARRFQRLFETVAHAWIEEQDWNIETWHAFRNRVNGAVDDLVRLRKSGHRSAVFTSVGPITVIVQRAVQCSDRVALETGWRIRNCSLTEFVYSGDRFTLDRFNALPHLDQQEWTYR